MPNPFFQFKQFKIYQDKTVMKVCTDSCLFGAWVAARFRSEAIDTIHDILDIGTGTGLLSIMLAQAIQGKIDAIEIDAASAAQAEENVTASPWKGRINIISGDIRTHVFSKQYDLIVCNPPFYENDLKSGNRPKDQAMHDSSLTVAVLLPIVAELMRVGGAFSALIPFHRLQYFLSVAEKNNLRNTYQLLVKPTPRHTFTRVVVLLEKKETAADAEETVTDKLVIKETHHNYSEKFINYLQDYYLSL